MTKISVSSKIPYPLPVRVNAVDIGTTSLKTAAYTFDPEKGLTALETCPWKRYETSMRSLPDGSKFTLLTGPELRQLTETLEQNICIINEKYQPAKLLVISGLTNSLSASFGFETVVFLDDPSLTAKPETNDLSVLQKYFGESYKSPPAASSLSKILALKNNPQIIKDLFGKYVTFSDLLFSTLLGTVTDVLTTHATGNIIPSDDVRGFGENMLDADTLETMLPALGVGRTQLQYRRSRIVPANNMSVYQINDFAAEIQAIKKFIKEKAIKPKSVIIALDSVGKIISDLPIMPHKLQGLGYTTQRITGNIMHEWVKYLYPEIYDKNEPGFYMMVSNNLDKIAGEKYAPKSKFLPDDGPIGTLYDIDEKPIKQADLENIDEEKRYDYLASVCMGTICALKQKIEKIWKDNGNSKTPIYVYGGLGSNNQAGWDKLIAQIFPVTEITRLNIPSAMNSTVFCALAELDWENEFEL